MIVTWGDAGARAARAATSTVPIVVMTDDLLGASLVTSMQHPGGNITGISVMATELDVKRLEILSLLLPKESNVLLLADRRGPHLSRPQLRAAAHALRLHLTESVVETPEEIESTLSSASSAGIAGVNVLASPVLYDHRARIITSVARHKLPAIYEWPFMAEEGGLIGYGPEIDALFRQFVGLVVKILQGADVSALPVEQPTRIQLTINLKTAEAIGVPIPQSLLARADRLVQ